MKHEQIELSKLAASKNNVRKTYSEDGIKEMKASLLAHGLMQNLVVKKSGDKFEVVSGNRRLVALQQLEKEGKLGKNNLINCRVMIAGESSQELSLAENVIREEMHPADEYEAFSELMKDKSNTVEKIALRFGVTKKHVEQRLLLGRLAPELMKAFRAEKIDLDCLMAFTICDDHKKQISVFKSLSQWDKRPATIRSKFTDKMVDADSDSAKLVGEAVYLKAGGTIKGDLFSKQRYFENKALLDKLVNAKIKLEVDKLTAEGWGFVEVGQDYGYDFTSKFERLDKAPKKSELSNCGVYMYIRDGKFDKTMLKKINKKSDKAAAKSKSGGADVSEALRTDLANYRMEIAQLATALNPNLAVDLMIYQIASQIGGVHRYGDYAMLLLDEQKPSKGVSEVKTAARARLKERLDELDLSWRKMKTEEERFNAFLKLNNAEKSKLFAYAFAKTIRAHYTGKHDKNDVFDLAFNYLPIAPENFWRPTKDNYLSRIKIDQLNAIGKELFEKDWKPQTKKALLVKSLHETFADPKKAANGSLERQKRIEAWLPAGFGFSLPSDALNKRAA